MTYSFYLMDMKYRLFFRYWLILELLYQVYLHIQWGGIQGYDWERYVVQRNIQSLITIQDYFKTYPSLSFVYAENPQEGHADLSTLPPKIQQAIKKLKYDLLNGMDFRKQRQMFSFSYDKEENNRYVIQIHAGAVFRSNYNGYQFSLAITNNPSKWSLRDSEEILPNLFVYRVVNQKYRGFPIVCSYNCNRYDLLVWKILNPLVQFIVDF